MKQNNTTIRDIGRSKNEKRSRLTQHNNMIGYPSTLLLGCVVMQSFVRRERKRVSFPSVPMLPSLFAIQVTNYRVAQGLRTMKTSPVVLPHCVIAQDLHPLGRMWKADLHRDFQVLAQVRGRSG